MSKHNMVLIKPSQTDLLKCALKNVTVELKTGQLPTVSILGTGIKSKPNMLPDYISETIPNTVFEAVMLAREVANILGLEAHIVKSDGGTYTRHVEQLITSEFTRDDVREVLKNHGVCSVSITTEMVKPLRDAINKHLKQSGIYDGSARLTRIKPNHPRVIQMTTKEWDCREAMAFNIGADGFIAFAGWASDKNVRPILLGALEWSYNNNLC